MSENASVANSRTTVSGLGIGQPVVRPVSGYKAALVRIGLAHIGIVFRLLRSCAPILRLPKLAVVTRYDDVKEVFVADDAFGVPYAQKLDVIMGGKPFFLGMDDTPEYRRDTQAMRMVVRVDDVAGRLAPAAEAAAERVVADGNGRLEVVGDLVRRVTFDVLLDYFGTPPPANGDLMVWASRLFEFQFADDGNDPKLAAEIAVYAPVLRAHIQGLIDARRGSGETRDDILGRCLAMQAQGGDGFSDDQIRCALIGFIVGGLPQPPMVAPQALDQLLRRPAALASAKAAAQLGNDTKLRGYVLEAMRFDPLGPFLMRTVRRRYTLAEGTSRATTLDKGMKVLVSFASAMMDPRRVRAPSRFDSARPPCNYMHFGHGLHECFGIHIMRALLPLMLKPLLKRQDLARAPGVEGRLRKQGAFADSLVVTYR